MSLLKVTGGERYDICVDKGGHKESEKCWEFLLDYIRARLHLRPKTSMKRIT